jgi:hypothetical protein
MVSVRTVLISLGIAFTAYLAARGLLWTGGTVDQPSVLILAFLLYLVTTLLCLFVEPERRPETADAEHPADAGDQPQLTAGPRGPVRLPRWVSALAIATSVIVPNAIMLAVGQESRSAPFATWYIGGIGALMVIVMVRRRTWVAWSGIALLAVSSMAWLGPLNALALGLVGSVMWVVVAQLLLASLDRAARDTARLAQLQRAASAWRASQTGRQRERRIQVQRALAVAGPILSRTIEQSGSLDARERIEARIAEGQLRDELRGPRLLDDIVRAELDAARRRGATVTVLDEGGLDGLDDDQLWSIRAELAAAVHDATSDRLYIRTSPDDRVAVTVVGRSAAGGALTDEDSVDLWREIPRPA